MQGRFKSLWIVALGLMVCSEALAQNVCPEDELAPRKAKVEVELSPDQPSYFDDISITVVVPEERAQDTLAVIVYYRYHVEADFSRFVMLERDEDSPDTWTGTIPAMPEDKREIYLRQKSPVALEYYVLAVDKKGRKREVYGGRRHPVCLPLLKERLELVEEAELAAWESSEEQAKPKVGATKRAKPKKKPQKPQKPVLPSFEDIMEREFQLISGEEEISAAAKGKLKLREAPSAVTVLTADDIRNYGSPQIVDVLRMVPGMDFIVISHSDYNLTLRGFNREGANKLLVLIDGRSVYVDLFGITFWSTLPIAIDEVKRIEVVRGPGSSLYGANAFSGIVDIVTYSPKDLEGALHYSLYYGRYGLTVSALTGDVSGKLGYKVSTSYNRSKLYDDPDSISNENLRGNLTIEGDFSDLGLKLGFSGGISRDDIAYLFSLIGPVHPWGTQGYGKLNAEYKISDSMNLKWQAYLNVIDVDIEMSFPLPKTVILNSADLGLGNAQYTYNIEDLIGEVPKGVVLSALGYTFDTELQWTWTYWNNSRLIAGTEYRLIWFHADELIDPDTAIHLFSVYAQNELRLLSGKLILNTGLRIDVRKVDEEEPLDQPPDSKPWDQLSDKEKHTFFPEAEYICAQPDPENPNRCLQEVFAEFKPYPTTGETLPPRVNYSPRVSVVYNPIYTHTFRLSFGMAYRNPAYFESFMQVPVLKPFTPSNIQTVGDIITDDPRNGLVFHGNPEAEPEMLLSFEFGYGLGLLNEKLQINLNTFYNKVYNLILFQGRLDYFVDYILNGNTLIDNRKGRTYDIFYFTNNINADSAGFELELRYQITKWLKLIANYSFQKIWIANEDEVIDDYIAQHNRDWDYNNWGLLELKRKQLTRSDVSIEDITTVHKENPEHKFNLGVNFRMKGFSVNTYLHFVSATERQQFLTRITNYKYTLTLKTADNEYQSYGVPLSKTTSGGSAVSNLYSVTEVPAYVIWNVNASYAFFEGKMELGVSAFDLLHLNSIWENVPNYGFDLQYDQQGNLRKVGIRPPRYIQYPRINLFGQITGGEVLPSTIYFFVRGRI